ncbi:MAG: hypothetical protein WC479_04585 [Candidatus Izemoplasmatales bacterium]
MLTVRVVSNKGHEIVEEAEVVTLYTAEESNDGKRRVMYFKNVHSDKDGQEVLDGHVFVMNENGKTIATYHLFPELEKR